MNTHIFQIPLHEMLIAFGTGVILGMVYMYLLWVTVKTLPKTKHRGLFLFTSAVLRIFLLIFGALALSQEHAGRFIIIFCGIITIRLFVLRFTKMGAYHLTEQKQMTEALKAPKKRKKRTGKGSRK